MKLSDKQKIFTTNISLLIWHANGLGIELTMGDAFRSKSQMLLNYYGYRVVEKNGALEFVKSQKVSWTLNSKHGDRMAQDFNFFIDGELVWSHHKIDALGEFWESLHPSNRWGGNFKNKDKPHFESRKNKKYWS